VSAPTVGRRRRASARNALLVDEVRRTHAFLLVSGALAVVGAVATFLFDGEPLWRLLFVGGVSVLLAGYIALYRWTRDVRRYRPTQAVAVVTVCNLAGVAACMYYGMFSPAPMILMLPVAYIGMSCSGAAAWLAYAVAALSIAIPMVLIGTGVVQDPGLVRADELPLVPKLLYVALVQAVYLTGLLQARGSRKVTAAAITRLEGALKQMRRQDALLGEAQERLAEVNIEGLPGPMTGTQVAGWTLGGLLGRGAMGDVYVAQRGDEEAAIKLLNPVAASDPESIALMRREASMLMGLSSPHVVRILETGVEPLPWLAMERLRGESLGDLLRRERTVGLDELRRLAQHVGEGLEVARRASILHRDLKPSNLFLTEDGLWRILDFGVAKRLGTDSTMTQGQLLGTPGYIAPEQIEDSEMDARGDVFAMAAVLYRCLTGTPPFAGRGPAVLVSTLFDQPERPSAWVEVPAAVDDVFAIALAKDPRQRFDTGLQFAEALTEALDGASDEGVERKASALLRQAPWGSSLRPSARP